MFDRQQVSVKIIARKYLYLLISFCIFYFGTSDIFAQKSPHLNASQFKEGLLELDFKNAWRYHPGNNLEWANPNFDDTNWHTINPYNLKVYRMPDSLWTGYGWWRMNFTASPSIIEEIERLYFYSWGAAEIYLDGKLVATYGNFSEESQNEKTYTPDYKGDRPLIISPQEIHTLAVRFSHHQAKKNHQIFRYYAENLGFDIGFSTAVRAEYSDFRYANSFAVLSVIVVVLSILLLLHLLLSIKFRKEQAYRVVTVITFLFLAAATCAHILLFAELDGFSNPIFSSILNSTSFALGFGLLPYSLSTLFRLPKFYWTKHLVWLALLRTANYFINVFNFILFDAVVILVVIILMVIVMRLATKQKNKGAYFITFGAIGTAVFLLVNRMINADLITVSTPYIMWISYCFILVIHWVSIFTLLTNTGNFLLPWSRR
jgi:hypothetical protein